MRSLAPLLSSLALPLTLTASASLLDIPYYDVTSAGLTESSSHAPYGNPTSVFMPPGCTCLESGFGVSSCVRFDCGCMCDATAGQCDLNCCCDPDCSETMLDNFAEKGDCLPETRDKNKGIKDQCYDSGQMSAVNPKYPMRSSKVTEDAYRSLLCVHTDNSQVVGTFFDSGRSLAALYPPANLVFAAGRLGRKEADFSSLADKSSRLRRGAEEDGTWDRGDRIKAARIRPSDSKTVEAFGGALPVPSPGFDGKCDDFKAASFGVTVDAADNSCWRDVDNTDATTFQKACLGDLAYGRFADNLFVPKRQNVNPTSSAPIGTDFARITYSIVGNDDWTSSLPDGGGTTSESGETLVADPLHLTRYDATTGDCINALKDVTYHVYFDGNSHIGRVHARVTVADVAALSGSWEQSFGVAFHEYGPQVIRGYNATLEATADGEKPTKLAGNSFVLRSKSGSAGYGMLEPVLAAAAYPVETLADPDKGMMAMLMFQDGLNVMTPAADGQCTTDGYLSGGKYIVPRTQVRFGEDMSVGCVKTLTVAQLQTLCSAPNANLDKFADGDRYLPKWLIPALNGDSLYVGIFGNADPLDKSQWLEVVKSNQNQDSDPAFDAATNTCKYLPTAAHYRFLWSNVGSVANPQAKIVSARVDYEAFHDLQFLDDNSGDADKTQNFPFEVTVSWAYYQRDESIYTPPAPPIIFSVPYDVFYPFEITNAAESASRRGALLALFVTGFVSIVVAVALS